MRLKLGDTEARGDSNPGVKKSHHLQFLATFSDHLDHMALTSLSSRHLITDVLKVLSSVHMSFGSEPLVGWMVGVGELLRMLLVTELQRNGGILSLQSIEQPSHHEGDLGLAHVVGVAPHAPGEGKLAQRWEFAEDKNHLKNVLFLQIIHLQDVGRLPGASSLCTL